MSRLVLLVALLALGSTPAAAETNAYSSGPLHLPIPAGATIEPSLTVPDTGRLTHVQVSVRITGARASDLTLTLVGPHGTEIVLARNRGGNGVGFGARAAGCTGQQAVFDDRADTPVSLGSAPFVDQLWYRPEQPLAAYAGGDARGTWKLRVESSLGATPGTLACWSLDLSRDVVETATATSGDVRAVLTYKEDEGFSRDARLRIVRGGVQRLDIPLRRLTGSRLVRLLVRDLDADGRPEVLVELYTNGAHCCTVTLVYRYDAQTRRYEGVSRNWGDPGYRLADLDGDGRLELVSADDRFAYEFTAFAGSALPAQIWHYANGAFVDVTRRFPGVTRREAASLWSAYLSDRRQRLDVRGVLAAWAADEELLGRGAAVWPALQAAYERGDVSPPVAASGWPQGQAYIRALRTFLRKTGYSR